MKRLTDVFGKDNEYELKCLCTYGTDGKISDISTCSDYCNDISWYTHDANCNNCGIQKAIDRLGAYEDTELTPEQITEMKADYERRENLRRETEKLFIKEGYKPCPNCGGRNISAVRKRVVRHGNTRYWYYYGLCRSCGHKGGLSDNFLGFPAAWNEHIESERRNKTNDM